MVLCLVTRNDCFNVFSVSKLATYKVSDFSSAVCARSFNKGACARQMGHQSAWNTTAMGLPTARIESNCAWSNGTSAEIARVATQINMTERAAAMRDFMDSPDTGDMQLTRDQSTLLQRRIPADRPTRYLGFLPPAGPILKVLYAVV